VKQQWHISHEGVDLRGIVIDGETPWLEDYTARALVVMHPGGMSLQEIGAVMRGESNNSNGKRMSHERVRQILAGAIRKLKRNPATRDWVEAVEWAETRKRGTMDTAPPDAGAWWESPAQRREQLAATRARRTAAERARRLRHRLRQLADSRLPLDLSSAAPEQGA
jgi:hypothetical protein